MIILIPLLATLTASALSPLQTSLVQNDNYFFNFPRVKQITQQIRSRAVISSTAVADRGLNLALDFNQTNHPAIPRNYLLIANGIHQTEQKSLSSGLTLGVRDAGVFNSTELSLQGNWLSRDWQKIDEAIPSVDSYRDYSLSVSYDLIRGGHDDPNYLNNKSIEKVEFANLLGSTDQLINAYIEYRFLLLDIYSSFCKLKTSNDDLEVVKRVLREIKLSYQLKSTSYKQYLNVLDTFNYISRNNVSFELSFQTNLQRLYYWGDIQLDEWKENFTKTVKCPTKAEQLANFHVGKIEEIPNFNETILAHQTKANAEGAKYAYSLAKQQVRPSVRPYIELGHEDSAGFDNKRYAVGIRINWDVASPKTNGQVKASYYSLGSTRMAVEAAERQYLAQVKTSLITFDKTLELLRLSLDSLQNSNSLVELLEVQKSIGQVDSVSLSNAYTQRNQVLNTIFDSIVNLEKTSQQIYYLKNWKELLNKAGIHLK